jgi:hypothetical protein
VRCYRKGTLITVKLDCDARTLSFSINGTAYGPAWSNLNVANPLFPSIDIDTAGAVFTIVSRKVSSVCVVSSRMLIEPPQ